MDDRVPLSPKQARLLTDRIVSTPADRWSRIAEGHARGAATALGYTSWQEYCDAEFGPDRFRIPRRHRYQVLSELKDAGLSFEDVEVAVIPKGRARPNLPAPLSLPAGQAPAGQGRGPQMEDQLGFSAEELELIGALLEVDDDEFRRVLVAGDHRHDLSAEFVRDQLHVVIASRETLERNLDRALRSVERAQDLVERAGQATDGDTDPTTRDLLKLLEDMTWDLVDTIDRLNVTLDHRRAGA